MTTSPKSEQAPPEGPYGSWGTPSWEQDRGPKRLSRWQKWGVLGGCFLSSFLLIAAFWFGAPLLGRPWNTQGLLPLVAGGGVGWWTFTTWRGSAGIGFWRAVGAVAGSLVLVAAFGWGVANSVEVDGKIFLRGSPQAQRYELAKELAENVSLYLEADELLGLDAAALQARVRELEPMGVLLQAQSDRWTLYDLAKTPDDGLVPLVENSKAAAFFGAKAIEIKGNMVGVSDERLAAELDALRLRFIEQGTVLAAGLEVLAQEWGVTF